jgi:hypothetical protein
MCPDDWMGDSKGMYICNICGFPINGTMIGNGNGWGQDFAHPDCYWKEQCQIKDKKIETLERKINTLEDTIEYLYTDKFFKKGEI